MDAHRDDAAWLARQRELRRELEELAITLVGQLSRGELRAIRAALTTRADHLALARALKPAARLTDDDNVLRFFLDAAEPSIRRRDAASATHLLALARWGQAGLPTVHLSGVQAAALMLSDLSAEHLEPLLPPWRAFRIVLDEPLVVDELGDRFERLDLHHFETSLQSQEEGAGHDFAAIVCPMWQIWIFGESRRYAIGGWDARRLYERLVLERTLLDLTDPIVPVHDADHRVQAMMTRLVLNLCMALQGDEHGPAFAGLGPRTRRKKGDKRRRSTSLAGGQHLELRWTPGVDVRQHVADYLSGDLKRYRKFRWVVRGHWKSQPHGRGRTLRRRIWIAPYFQQRDPALLDERPPRPDATDAAARPRPART